MLDKNINDQEKSSPIRKRKVPKRTLIKKSGKLPEGIIEGCVVASLGRIFLVRPSGLSENSSESLVDCITAGKIISPNGFASIVAVGDIVSFLPEQNFSEDTGLKTGTIVEVKERIRKLSRRAAGQKEKEHVIASNIDKLLILASVADPFYNKRLIDRYLVAAELGNIEPALCINKIDLAEMEELEEDLFAYEELGLKMFFISAKENKGIEELKEFLKDSKTVFSGASGAGKSTLVNNLLGSEIQVVQEISEKTGKGRHTTSFVREFCLPGGGYIIDSPGIREYAVHGLDKEELSLYFHDFDQFRHDCKYLPCSHTHEPNCSVKDAVEEGDLDYERYESYMYMLETMS